MTMTSGLKLLAIGLAIVVVPACGSLSGAEGGTATPLAERITAPQPKETPPDVRGTYSGSYTEKENGKTESGTFQMVIHQHRFRIMGTFDTHVNQYTFNYYFSGKVRQAGSVAKLRFEVGMLGGYDINVTVHATIVNGYLTGTGHGGYTKQRNRSHWTFQATKT